MDSAIGSTTGTVPVTVVLQVLFEHFYRFEEPVKPPMEVAVAPGESLAREIGDDRAGRAHQP